MGKKTVGMLKLLCVCLWMGLVAGCSSQPETVKVSKSRPTIPSEVALPTLSPTPVSSAQASTPSPSESSHTSKKLASPANLKLVVADSQLTLNWEPVPGAETYEVFYSEGNSQTEAKPFPCSNTALNSCTITGLSNGKRYYTWVKALATDKSPSDLSSSPTPISAVPREATSAPAAPKEIKPLTQNDKTILTWEPVPDALCYQIKQSTINDETTGTVVKDCITADNYYEIKDVVTGKKYYIWVKGKNILGESPLSTAVIVEPKAAISTPTNLNAIPSDSMLTVSWGMVSNAASYEVYYNTEDNPDTAIKSPCLNPEINSCVISGLQNSVKYYTWVKALDKDGVVSKISTTAQHSSTTPALPLTKPEIPANLAAIPDHKTVLLTWGAVAGATSYTVAYSTTNTISTAQVVNSCKNANNYCLVENLTNNTPYYFWIKSKNSIGESEFSEPIIAAPRLELTVPQNMELVISDTKLTATWDKIEDALSYEVYYSLTNTPESATKFPCAEPAMSTCTLENLQNGSKYYVWVKALYENNGKSALNVSAEESYAIPAKPTSSPASPQKLTSSNGNGEVLLGWRAVAGATSYKVLYSNANDPSTAQIVSNCQSASNFCAMEGVTSTTPYYFWVMAENELGISSLSDTLTLIPNIKAATAVLLSPAQSPGNVAIPVFKASVTEGNPEGKSFTAGETLSLHASGVCFGSQLEQKSLTAAASEVSLSATTSVTPNTFLSFSIKRTDTLGNSACSDEVVYYYDTLVTTPVLSLASPTSSPGNVGTPTFLASGGFEAGDTLSLFAQANCGGTIVASQALSASVNSVSLIPSQNVAAGSSVSYSISNIDNVGNIACSNAIIYYYDNAVTTPSLALQSPASSPSNDSTPTFRVTAVANQGGTADAQSFAIGDMLTLHATSNCSGSAIATSGSLTGGETQVDLTPESAVTANSSVSYTVKNTDIAGNTSCSGAITYYYDTVIVTPSIALQSPSITPNIDSTPTFRVTGGTFAVGDNLTLHASNNCSGGSIATSGSLGSNQTQVDLTPGSAVSANSNVTYTVLNTDAVGNIACSNAIAYYYDTVIVTPSLALQSPAASPSNDGTPTFRVTGGTYAAGDTLTLHATSNCTGSAIATSGSLTGGETQKDLTPASAVDANTSITYSVLNTDNAGNTLCSNGVIYYYDVSIVTPILALSSPASSPNTDSTPTFRISGGTYSVGDTLTLHASTDCSGGSLTSTVLGTTPTEVFLTPDSGVGANSSISYTVKNYDGANTACSNAISYYYDTVIVTPSAALQSPAASPANDSTPTFRVTGGTYAAGDTLTLHATSNCTGSAIATSGSLTGGETQVDVTPGSTVTANSSVNYTVKNTDNAGNTACTASPVAYYYDNAVTTPSVALQSPSVSPANDATPTFRVTGGTFAIGDTLTLHATSNCSGGSIATSGVLGSSQTQIDLTPGSDVTANSSISYTVKNVDNVGNTSCSNAVAYYYDNAVTTPSVARQSPSTTPNIDSTPTFRVTGGTFEVGDTLALYATANCSGAVLASSLLGASTTQVDLTPGSDVAADSNVSYTVLNTDNVGNIACSDVVNYYYDTIIVTPSTALQSPTSSPGNDGTPTFRVTGGTFAVGDTLTLHASSDCSGGSIATSGSLGSIQTQVDLTPGSNVTANSNVSYTVKNTDNAGNTQCSSSVAYYYDTAVITPSLALQSPAGSPGNDSTPTFRVTGGTFAIGDTLTLHASTDCSGGSIATSGALGSTQTQVDLTPGSNVTANSSVSYTVKNVDAVGNSACGNAVTYYYDNNVNLSALAISAGTLSPEFAAGTLIYTASVSNGTTSMTVTPTFPGLNATGQVRINGGSFAAIASGATSGSLSLNVGQNPIEVKITAADASDNKTYTITVTRAGSAISTLSALTLSSGTLSPSFASGTAGYTATVANATSSITVTPTVTEANATIQARVNGGSYAAVTSGQASGSLSLNEGDNTVDVKVTAQDGTTNQTYTVTVTRSLDYVSPNIGTLKYVPAGTFSRDGTYNSTITNPYRMSQYEITRTQFTAVTGLGDPTNVTYSTGTSDPVQKANWYHALVFCNKLSMLEGLTPVYTISGSTDPATWGAVPTTSNGTWDAATANWGANGYRLPTEMEWMWAAMGATGTYSKEFAGSTGSNAIGDYAWYSVNSSSKTHPAGTKLANELGLYDMSGNVWEWSWDWYGSYPNSHVTDYLGAASGTYRVSRGGSWSSDASVATVAYRIISLPYNPGNDIGFRVLRR